MTEWKFPLSPATAMPPSLAQSQKASLLIKGKKSSHDHGQPFLGVLQLFLSTNCYD